MSPTGGRPTLEEGWRTLADGMNLHRWFLAPHRQLDRLLDERLRAVASRMSLPPRDELCERWPRGLLLHMFEPSRPAAEISALLATTTRPVTAPVQASLTRYEPDRPLPAATVAGVTEPDRTTRRAQHLAERCGLGPLLRVSVELIVEVGAAPDAVTAFRQPAAAIVTAGESAVARALTLAGTGALHLLDGLWQEYRTPAAETATLPSPMSGERRPAKDVAAEIVYACTAHRLLTTLAEAPLPGDEQAERHRLLAGVRHDVPSLSRVVHELRDVIDETSYEYVNSTCPGPDQYVKYRLGCGMGQS